MNAVKPVWLWLPEATEPVIVGEYQLSNTGGRPLGALLYKDSYQKLPNAIPLDQQQLARFKGVAKTTAYEGLHDIFRDVKPEGFGLDMLQRRRNVTSLSNLDALEYSPGDAVGALEVCANIDEKARFVPHSSQAMFKAMDELDPAQSSAHVVHKVEDTISTSLGGERPKMTVLHKGQQWIAKFSGRQDDPTATLREYVSMRLAKLCGIDAAEVEYAHRNERGAVLVKRFDRHMQPDGSCHRVHFASAATVLGATAAERDNPNRTYIALAMNASRWRVQGHHAELWRRMAFNVLIGNGDDHPRNHGFPRDLAEILTLRQLHLPDAGLTSLPVELHFLRALESICVDGNKIKVLLPEIFGLYSLRRIDAEGNEIESIPDTIGQARHLQSLDLDGNNLKSISPEISRCQSLKRVYFRKQQHGVSLDHRDTPLSDNAMQALIEIESRGVDVRY